MKDAQQVSVEDNDESETSSKEEELSKANLKKFKVTVMLQNANSAALVSVRLEKQEQGVS